jgi:hypothetical protein
MQNIILIPSSKVNKINAIYFLQVNLIWEQINATVSYTVIHLRSPLFFLYVHIYLHFHSVLSRFRYHYLCLFIFFRNKQTVFLTLYLSFSFSLTVVNASLEIQVTNNGTHQIERYIGKKTKRTIFHRSIKDI